MPYVIPRSQAQAWERLCTRSPLLRVVSFLTRSRGFSASAFPSRGLGTRKLKCRIFQTVNP